MIANEHGGVVDKLIGDAIVVTFNTRGVSRITPSEPHGPGLPHSERQGGSSRAIRGGRAFGSA